MTSFMATPEVEQDIETISAYDGARIEILMEILRMRRPHKSSTEKHLMTRYLDVIPGMKSDGFGNRFIKIAESDILWSCHVDTVHKDGGYQLIEKKLDVITLSERAKSNCLGADDAAGIWLMLEMIEANVPGLYIFHRGEEVGGLGSDFIAKHNPKLLEGVKAAIALDRMGYHDIITHQGGRGCSELFALSLADALDMNYVPDSSGIFTDTACYFGLVNECTNISVGYFAQHTARESLDMDFLVKLRAALLKFDESKLIIEREPGEYDAYDSYYNDYGYGYGGGWGDNLDNSRGNNLYDSRGDTRYDPDGYMSKYDPDNTILVDTKGNPVNGFKIEDMEDVHDIIDLCKQYPETVARTLMSYGVTLDSLVEDILDDTGILPDYYK